MKSERPIEFIARGVCVVGDCLLLCRRKGTDYSYLPGGHIDPGEGARAALRRELNEELGRRATVGRFLGAVENHYTKRGGSTVCEINLIFEFHLRGLRSDRPPPSAEKRLVFEWTPLRRLARSDLQPALLRRWLSRALAVRSDAAWGSNYERGAARP